MSVGLLQPEALHGVTIFWSRAIPADAMVMVAGRQLVVGLPSVLVLQMRVKFRELLPWLRDPLLDLAPSALRAPLW